MEEWDLVEKFFNQIHEPEDEKVDKDETED